MDRLVDIPEDIEYTKMIHRLKNYYLSNKNISKKIKQEKLIFYRSFVQQNQENINEQKGHYLLVV